MQLFNPLCLAISLLLSASASAAPGMVFDVAELDTSVSPCRDFDAFVNARWVQANPIPADKTRWGSFMALAEQSREAQHEILRQAERKAAAGSADAIERTVGELYRAGMDEAAIERAGYLPVEPELAAIARLQRPEEIVGYLRDSFARGAAPVFEFAAGSDYRNAGMQIAYAYQGGLSLPTPDYYTLPQYAELRAAYLEHIGKLLQLAGIPRAQAQSQAELALAFEARLARASLSPVDIRLPENQYHFVDFEQARALTPHFDWKHFFASQGLAGEKGFSLSQPGFFAEFDRMLVEVPAAQWQAYLRARLLDRAAPLLSRPFQEQSFAFHDQTLNGQQQQSVRWKRVLDAVNDSAGEALGQLYVRQHFSPQAKARAQELVDNVRLALRQRIEKLDWMSDATKGEAIAKWNTFLPKIGYPDRWRDWSGLEIHPGDYYGSVQAAAAFNYRHDLGKIGKPTDRQQWEMTPQTVNAYYNPTDNSINFPAAILQPPFFYPQGDDAINYGGIGAVIGHEASHGFDDQGSKFDGAGNNRDWWSKADRQAFEARAHKLVEQFDAYAPIAAKPQLRVNGELTLGENIGDLGGLNAAYDALQLALAKKPAEAGAKIDGYSQEQRFFLSWARVWRGSIRDRQAEVLLNADPHAPMQIRVIGAPSNMPAFARAFQCQAGDPMVRPAEQRVDIW